MIAVMSTVRKMLKFDADGQIEYLQQIDDEKGIEKEIQPKKIDDKQMLMETQTNIEKETQSKESNDMSKRPGFRYVNKRKESISSAADKWVLKHSSKVLRLSDHSFRPIETSSLFKNKGRKRTAGSSQKSAKKSKMQ